MADGLDMRITCKAIRNAALGKGFLTYSELAKEHGADIDDVYHPLIAQLNELLKICFKNGWPALPVIVVAEGTEKLTGKNLRAFCKSARKAGYDFRDCEEFADQQRRLIEWAKNADAECTAESDRDDDGNEGTGYGDGEGGAGDVDGGGGGTDHRGGGFDIRITYRMIVAAACKREVIHYTDITDAHDMEMNQVLNQLFNHLDEVLKISFERDWPALTAIIVPAGTDHLSGKGLKGFCDSAKRAGYEFDDCETFAREQMEAVFDWTQTADTEFAIERDGDKDGTGGKVAKEYKGDHGDDGFDIRITYRMIVAAARKRRVLHYTDITDAHDMEMNQVLNQLFSHLDEVLKISFERDWPALTAIIVPVRTDHLAGKGLRGFCDSAGRAGYEFDDCATFAREQMEAVFDWAPTAGTEFEPTNGGSKDSSSPTGTKSAYLTIIGLISIVGIAAYYLL